MQRKEHFRWLETSVKAKVQETGGEERETKKKNFLKYEWFPLGGPPVIPGVTGGGLGGELTPSAVPWRAHAAHPSPGPGPVTALGPLAPGGQYGTTRVQPHSRFYETWYERNGRSEVLTWGPQVNLRDYCLPSSDPPAPVCGLLPPCCIGQLRAAWVPRGHQPESELGACQCGLSLVWGEKASTHPPS